MFLTLFNAYSIYMVILIQNFIIFFSQTYFHFTCFQTLNWGIIQEIICNQLNKGT
jgi:hypothetical protein